MPHHFIADFWLQGTSASFGSDGHQPPSTAWTLDTGDEAHLVIGAAWEGVERHGCGPAAGAGTYLIQWHYGYPKDTEESSGCRIEHGDARTARLGNTFPTVHLRDVAHLTPDAYWLRAVLTTVLAHLDPDGIALLSPAFVEGSFRPSICAAVASQTDDDAFVVQTATWQPLGPSSGHYRVDSTRFWPRDEQGTAMQAGQDHALFSTEEWRRSALEVGFVSVTALRAGTDTPLLIARGPSAAPRRRRAPLRPTERVGSELLVCARLWMGALHGGFNADLSILKRALYLFIRFNNHFPWDGCRTHPGDIDGVHALDVYSATEDHIELRGAGDLVGSNTPYVFLLMACWTDGPTTRVSVRWSLKRLAHKKSYLARKMTNRELPGMDAPWDYQWELSDREEVIDARP